MALLLFDLDDTLIAEVPAAAAAFAATAAYAATRHPGIDAEALARDVRVKARAAWRAAPVHPYCLKVGISSSEALWCRFEGAGDETAWLREWAPRYRRGAWAAALAAQGAPDRGLAQDLAARFGEERRARHLLFPDVPAVLEALRPDHRLVLVTNGASCLQREKIEGTGLGGRFDRVVVSGDTGAGKPDPAIFRDALAGADPGEAWMIGDSLDRDVRGALDAGLRAVWVDRFGAPGEHSPRIASLAELPALLQADG